MESLYLNWGNNAEVGFRLALSGAWHLGKNLEDRRNIYQTLLDAYSQGSAAVHPRDLVVSRVTENSFRTLKPSAVEESSRCSKEVLQKT